MTRQDPNEQFSTLLLPLWRQCRLYRGALRPATRPTPEQSIRAGRVLSAAEGRRPLVAEECRGPVLGAAPTGRRPPNGELVSALDGNWRTIEQGASADKIKAKADLRRRELSAAEVAAGDARLRPRHHDDPRLPHARPSACRSRSAEARAEARPRGAASRRAYGFTEADYDRKIFIDNVLGLEFATIREMLAILERTYCSTIGVEYMHISDPAREGLDPGAHRRARQGDRLHAAKARRRSSTSWSRPRASRSSSTSSITGTKRFGLDGARIADPGARADHQARRRARRAARSCSAWPIAAASTCSPR